MSTVDGDRTKKDNNIYLSDFAEFQRRIRLVFPDAAINYSDTNMIGSTHILSARVGTKAVDIHAPGAAGSRHYRHSDYGYVFEIRSLSASRKCDDKHEAVEILIELLKEG